MKQITIYTTKICPYCVQAKALLKRLGLPYTDISLEDKPELRKKLSDENNGYRTVPMIFIDNKFIGGYMELEALARANKLQ